jgi:hypothetical protein
MTDSITRIDEEDGRFTPKMFDLVDYTTEPPTTEELSAREMMLIAKSHGYKLHLVETGVEVNDSFKEAYEDLSPPWVRGELGELYGAWDTEDGEIILAYLRPLPALA